MRDCEYTRSGNLSEDEMAFLENYNPDVYKKTSVTADIVTLTVDSSGNLCILLVKRSGYPYKDKWALPGGFMQVDEESVTQAAARELEEETKVTDVSLRQLYTFSDPERDPRMHVVDVAYTALVPRGQLTFEAGDDASSAELFCIRYDVDGMSFRSRFLTICEKDLAFDHAKIIRMAIKRLRGRIRYEPDAFWLLHDRHEFTISELKTVYEAIRNERLDLGNFRKVFFRDFVNTGRVVSLGKVENTHRNRPAMLYDYIEVLDEEF